eukprot:403335462
MFQQYCQSALDNAINIKDDNMDQDDEQMTNGMHFDGGNQAAYDDCEQLELIFIPNAISSQVTNITDQQQNKHDTENNKQDEDDEVTMIRKAFEECNMLNPDSDDSQDEEQEELFTKEYFERMEQEQQQHMHDEQDCDDNNNNNNGDEEDSDVDSGDEYNENTMDLNQ